MTLKEIKVGETYNVRVKVTSTEKGLTEVEITAVVVDANEKKLSPDVIYFSESDIAAFSPITPENGTKNSETAPKYDPCRLFRKGDKVRVVTYKGRNKTGVQAGEIGSIYKDEKDADVAVEVIFYGDDLWEVDPAYLELVTPVEELKPYCIADHIHGWIVYKDTPGNVVANFNKSHPHAKEAAEAECKRLNAEYRKETSHELVRQVLF